ncbi:hypothetical protein [Catellatospora chokoriensis]|uniref:Uncharacterized protein n=1 Tax=Catellatospora chokoriensis TaxID=310353 RepID=A0A8J3K4C8_9ACTN|nr:hypothetical protein [Catellatospora chokoriensis]GIF92242.1 hypothetical protein Cch02nite_56860 [Catellatospora chokoriensis]
MIVSSEELSKVRRRAAGVVTALATVLIGLAGCGGSGEPAAPATSAPALAAEEVFATAAEALTTQPLQFKMEMRGLFSINGWMDVTARTAEVMGSMPIDGKSTAVHMLGTADDVWLKIDADSPSEKWMHATAAQLAGTTFDFTAPDNPGGVLGLVNAVNKVESAGTRRYQGTVDMTTSPTYDPATAGALADKLSAVPFQATVDEQGRLSTFRVDLTGLTPNLVMTASYTYGVPVVVKAPPAAEVIEMPATIVANLRS